MPNYGDPGYWDQRYKEQDGTVFDWLEDYEAIEPLLEDLFVNRDDYSESNTSWRANIKILNLGCGNSILSEEMYDKGYHQIYNIDISPVVIEQMAKRNAIQRPELQWEVMDVRDLKYQTHTFDLIIDKSTIDALLCGDNAFMNTALMMKECQRVIKPEGGYMAISYGTPENRVLHYKRPHLKFNVSTFEIAPEGKKSQDAVHYVYVCKKQEGADEQCEENWTQVEQQIKKEENDDLLEDSDDEEEQKTAQVNQQDIIKDSTLVNQ
eukprot:403355957